MKPVRDMNDILPGMRGRRKAFRMSPGVLLTLMGCWRKHEAFTLPVLELPADAVLADVYYDPHLREFLFMVYSETFPEVPDGDYAPAVKAEWQNVDLHAGFLHAMSRYISARTFGGSEEYPDEELLREARRIVEAGVTRPPLTRLEQMDRDLDSGRFVTLHAIGDIHEEAGNHVLAAGYHWLAAQRRWPIRYNGYYEWLTPETYTASACPGSHENHDWLPAEVYDRLPKRLPGTLEWARNAIVTVSRTESEALRLAAQAAGEWLKEEGV